LAPELAAEKATQEQTLFKSLSLDTEAGSEAEPSQEDVKRVRSSLFVPPFVDRKKNPYKLFYGPSNSYIFLTYFYSVYERLLKARFLIKKKIDQDFANDFSQCKWSIKFDKKVEALVDERFQYFVRAVFTTMSYSNVLDTNRYEDLSREFLGNEAYLLF